MIITSISHLDHDLTVGHLHFVLNRCKDRNEFFIESVALPDDLPSLPCALRGPIVGGSVVSGADVVMIVRGDRKWPSRMIDPAEAWDYPGGSSRLITIIGGPADGHPCVLYTAYGGPLAPKEPEDPSLHQPGQEEALANSVAFWAKHALVE